MFTGIIQKLGKVKHAEFGGSSDPAQATSLTLDVETGFADLEMGESVAVNGACLTVTETDPARTRFFISRETLDKTNLGHLRAGSRVNLERAVTLGTRLSGHLVQGHVDGVGKLAQVTSQAGAHLVRFELPARLGRYLVEKGSIALNGVSLTINTLSRSPERAEVAITLIPHTWENTEFSTLAVGAPINVEVDVLAKYVESLSQEYRPGGSS